MSIEDGVEAKLNAFFGDADPSGFGTGWWSGVLSIFFGLLSFGAVICLHFPQFLSSPELRAHYPMPLIRLLIQGVIVSAIAFGVLSAILRKKKVLAFTGMLFALLACLLVGASVAINETLHDGPAIGLDWFLLDMLITTLIFSPIEVLWPAYPEQGVFRREWLLDLEYFLSTHLPLQVTEFFILLPATQLTKVLPVTGIQTAVASLPWLVQLLLGVVIADIAEYWIHYALHKVPWLWRFHAIHHSAKSLDWIAGSRAHLIDDIIIRGGILIPMALCFSQSIIMAYLIFVTFHATWTHANFAPTAHWAEELIVQPRYHHWHHTSQREAIDKNFAIHFPWIDRLFGTHYLPKDRSWPTSYGLDGEQPPPSFLRQLVWPFQREKQQRT
jgi:lathosterol oxidase